MDTVLIQYTIVYCRFFLLYYICLDLTLTTITYNYLLKIYTEYECMNDNMFTQCTIDLLYILNVFYIYL